MWDLSIPTRDINIIIEVGLGSCLSLFYFTLLADGWVYSKWIILTFLREISLENAIFTMNICEQTAHCSHWNLILLLLASLIHCTNSGVAWILHINLEWGFFPLSLCISTRVASGRVWDNCVVILISVESLLFFYEFFEITVQFLF